MVTRKREKPHRLKCASPLTNSRRLHGSAADYILMIRLFTVFCKLNKISFSDRQWLERDLAGFSCPDASCPFCGAKGCMEPFAHYYRYLVELQDGTPVTYRVKIPRYQCASCGHTHALLSASLVPYRSYSLRFILHVLRAYFLRLKPVAALCEAANISPAALYEWKNAFLKQKGLFLGVLSDLAESPACFLETLDGGQLNGFYRMFRFSFLQGMPRRYQELPPGGQRERAAAT